MIFLIDKGNKMSNLKNSRRNFLKLVGAGTAAISLPGFKFLNDYEYNADLGLQFYTIRKNIEADFEESIHKVANTGFFK